MSWHCSLAVVEAFSDRGCLDAESCAQLKYPRIGESCFYGDKRKATSERSLFGMMCGPSTAARGVTQWMSSLAETHARINPACIRTESTENTHSRLAKSSCALSARSGPPGSSARILGPNERTPHAVPIGLPGGWKGWATPRRVLKSGRVVWALTIDALGCSCSPGYPTPIASTGGPDLTMGNRPGTGGNKLATKLAIEGEDGPPNPEFLEQLMGWPIGWTDMRPLAKAKFQQWCERHGSC